MRIRILIAALPVVLGVCLSASAEKLGERSGRSCMTIAGVANATGREGVLWRTDLSVTNLDPANSALIVVRLIDRGSHVDSSLSLGAGQRMDIENILQEMFDRQGLAVLEISVTGDLVEAELRTHDGSSCGSGGGTELTAANSSPFAGAGIDGLVHILLPVNVPTGSRLNLGVPNHSDSNAGVWWIIVDGDGRERSSGHLYLAAGESRQMNLEVGQPPISGGIADIWYVLDQFATSRFFPYVAIVDNVTNTGKIYAATWEGSGGRPCSPQR